MALTSSGTGLTITSNSNYPRQVEYSSIEGQASGAASLAAVPAGRSLHCVPVAEAYRLVPRGCHRVQPPEVILSMEAGDGDQVPVSICFRVILILREDVEGGLCEKSTTS